MLSRRVFLGAVAVIGGGSRAGVARQMGLDQFVLSAPPCTESPVLTPPVPVDAHYRPGSPRRASFIERGVTGTRLTVSGTVAGRTCGRIEGAEVDVWQADSRGVYDPGGFRLRGHQLTNADGRYRLATIVPGASAGLAPCLGMRVRLAGRLDFSTVAFFPDDPRNVADPRYRAELVMRVTRDDPERAATFDITVDL